MSLYEAIYTGIGDPDGGQSDLPMVEGHLLRKTDQRWLCIQCDETHSGIADFVVARCKGAHYPRGEAEPEAAAPPKQDEGGDPADRSAASREPRSVLVLTDLEGRLIRFFAWDGARRVTVSDTKTPEGTTVTVGSLWGSSWWRRPWRQLAAGALDRIDLTDTEGRRWLFRVTETDLESFQRWWDEPVQRDGLPEKLRAQIDAAEARGLAFSKIYSATRIHFDAKPAEPVAVAFAADDLYLWQLSDIHHATAPVDTAAKRITFGSYSVEQGSGNTGVDVGYRAGRLMKGGDRWMLFRLLDDRGNIIISFHGPHALFLALGKGDRRKYRTSNLVAGPPRDGTRRDAEQQNCAEAIPVHDKREGASRMIPEAWKAKPEWAQRLTQIVANQNLNGKGCPYYATGICLAKVVCQNYEAAGPDACSMYAASTSPMYRECGIWQMWPR